MVELKEYLKIRENVKSEMPNPKTILKKISLLAGRYPKFSEN
jgi:hypothetical protein